MNIEKELQKAIETANKANEAVLELKKKYEESLKPKSKVLKPKDDDKVWFVYKKWDGLEPTFDFMNWNSWQKWAYELGEFFPTKEACQKYIDKTLATERVKNKILELNGDWEPDWSNYMQLKFCIYYDHERKMFVFRERYSLQSSNSLPYSTKEACEYVIKNMQDDLKIIWDIK